MQGWDQGEREYVMADLSCSLNVQHLEEILCLSI
jgi:hypothetical protein